MKLRAFWLSTDHIYELYSQCNINFISNTLEYLKRGPRNLFQRTFSFTKYEISCKLVRAWKLMKTTCNTLYLRKMNKIELKTNVHSKISKLMLLLLEVSSYNNIILPTKFTRNPINRSLLCILTIDPHLIVQVYKIAFWLFFF